jgi:peptidoglycan/LPS O-acetylase OafA/YrhL
MQARQAHIDALKLIGSQLIVLHHLSAYGPVADAVNQAAPQLMRWLYDYARMAVQIFLVLGGFLAVQGLARVAQGDASALGRALARRYLRLALPFLAALLLAVACAALARAWLSADFIPAAPTWGQALAHALLLHGVLGVEALSAGVWYVAIDFQLFALLALLLWLGRQSGRRWLAPALVLGLTAASLFHFNRDAAWDNWALYFFGAYGLGAAAFWAGQSRRACLGLGLLALLGVLALGLDYRTRIALALGVALLLGVTQWRGITGEGWPLGLARVVEVLGRSSYALFLLHFPLLLLGNALFVALGLSGAAAAAALLLLTWTASMLLALGFERWVEAPSARLLRRGS